MLPYWILFSVFAAGSLQYRPRPYGLRQSAPLLTVFALVPMLMIGLRYEVGADWIPYEGIFSYISNLDFKGALAYDDPAYALVNWEVARLGLDLWAVNLVCAALFMFGLIRLAKLQPNPWLAVLVAIPYLVIVVAMGYTRQAVALGLIMAALAEWQHGRIIRFAALIVLAAMFHKTAIFVIPLVALSATRNKTIVALLMAGTGVALYYSFLSSSVDRMVTNYVTAEYNSQGAAIRVVMNLVPASLFLSFPSRFSRSEQERKLLRNFSIAAVATLALLFIVTSSTVVDRLALYLIPLQVVILSRVPDAFPLKERSNTQLLVVVIAYSAFVQFVWLNFATHSEFWVPYHLYPIGGS